MTGRQVFEGASGVGGADAVDQLQHAEGADGVMRIFGEAKDGDEVFHVGGFEELEAAVFDEGDVAPGQFHLQQIAVVGGAEEDGLFAQGDAGLQVFQNALDDVAGLLVFIDERHQSRLLLAGAGGKEILVVSLGGEGDHRVGGVEDGLDAAVVLFQFQDGGVGIDAGEIEDVVDGGH